MNAIFLVLVALPAALASFILEVRRKDTASPKDRPYTWGYFQGMSGLLLGIYILIAGMYFVTTGHSSAEAYVLLVLGAIWASAGYNVIKRRKWAWVVHTIASFNPVWWIANSIYAHNRWDELDRNTAKTPLNAYGLPLGQTAPVRK
jgi:hypothetical protein